MNTILRKALCIFLSFAVTWMPVVWQTARAEDIDLFVSATGSGVNPNILIVIDNSANWASASQHWAGGLKQGESELRALKTVLNEVRDSSSATASKFNLGLMLFTEGSGSDIDGAYLRYAIRPMTQYYIDKLVAIIGDSSCVDGNESVVPVSTDPIWGATGTSSSIPRCILKNFNGQEKVGTAKIDYSSGLFEVYKYFGAYSDVAHATLDQPGTPVATASSPHTFIAKDGTYPKRRAGTVESSSSAFGRLKYDLHAYTDSNRTAYNVPLNTSNSCAKNYVIFIGNGFPSTEPTAWDTELLANVNQSSSQLAMPQFTSTSTTITDKYDSGTTCET
ncbi:MAG TPA: hypothetical protein VD965_05960, partial [Burkholderiales bacterium]|nr:hypothetical protein [Burkholderiales bacterium]